MLLALGLLSAAMALACAGGSAAGSHSEASASTVVFHPCAEGGCEARDVGAIDLLSSGVGGGAAADPVEPSSLEEVLEQGLALAEASPVQLAVRGRTNAGSVRCGWRGVARTPQQREDAIRFWLDLDATAALPSPAEVQRRFTAELDRLGPAYPETVRANFRAIAQGGLSTEYLFLACYADYTVQEYLLGSGPSGTTPLSVSYDRQGEARSYDLYTRAHGAGEFGDEALMAEGEYEAYLSQLALDVETLLSIILEGRESVVFLAPMGAHNAIAVEAWQAVVQWDLQTDENDVVHAVRYGVPASDPESTQTLTNLRSRITTATTPPAPTPGSTPVPGPTRIPNASGLTQYYRDIGAYGDITPDDGETTTFTPAQPPPVPICASGTAVTNPGTNRGLVHDCEALLEAKDTLRGTASLDWSTGSAISSWEGVTTGGTPSRVTKMELGNESLSGSIPPALGTLFELTYLDLSSNSLTGDIPPELGWLHNLIRRLLDNNDLSREIPPELGGLSSLRWLAPDNNDLSGEIPAELSSLSFLTELSLGRNDLSGEIPAELGGLSFLTELSLDNDLSGCVPGSLEDQLDLSNSDLGDLPFC